jgi:hypothetical protein
LHESYTYSIVREAKGDKSGIDPLSLFIDKELEKIRDNQQNKTVCQTYIMDKLVYRIALGMVPVISQFIQELLDVPGCQKD